MVPLVKVKLMFYSQFYGHFLPKGPTAFTRSTTQLFMHGNLGPWSYGVTIVRVTMLVNLTSGSNSPSTGGFIYL